MQLAVQLFLLMALKLFNVLIIILKFSIKKIHVNLSEFENILIKKLDFSI